MLRRRAGSVLTPPLLLLLLSLLVVVVITCTTRTAATSVWADAVYTRAVYDVVLQRNDTHAGAQLTSTQYVLCDRYITPPTTTTTTTTNTARATTTTTTTHTFDAMTMAQQWCISSTGARVQQSVLWSSVLPPGLYIRDWHNVTLREVLLQCVLYSCDVENVMELDKNINSNSRSRSKGNNTSSSSDSSNNTSQEQPPALGGVGAATPCAGSTNHTFVLFTRTPSYAAAVVQSDALDFDALNDYALWRLQDAYCGSGQQQQQQEQQRQQQHDHDTKRDTTHDDDEDDDEDADVVTAPAATLSASCAVPASFCLIRLADPRFSGAVVPDATLLTSGDGTLTFPVWVSACHQDLSAVLSTSLDMLRSGYTAVVTLRDHVDTIALPRELIHAVASWTRYMAATGDDDDTDGGTEDVVGGGDADRRGVAMNTLTQTTTATTQRQQRHHLRATGARYWATTTATAMSEASLSLRDSGMCQWRHDSAHTTHYYTGDVYICRVHPSMRGKLPQLTLHVQDEYVARAMTSGRVIARDTDTTGAVADDDCSVTIDLNALVQRHGSHHDDSSSSSSSHRNDNNDTADNDSTTDDDVLVLYSSGSVEQWLRDRAIASYEEPFIVLGATALRGATMATTRDVRFATTRAAATRAAAGGAGERMARGDVGNTTDDDSGHRRRSGGGGGGAWRGLPLLYIAAYSASNTVTPVNNNNNNKQQHQYDDDDDGDKQHKTAAAMATRAAARSVTNNTYAGCVAPVRCEGDRTYFRAVNRCADTQCRGLLALRYSAVTLECSVNVPMLVVFAVLLVLVLVAEVVLLCVRAWSERVKEAYMQDMHRMLRK